MKTLTHYLSVAFLALAFFTFFLTSCSKDDDVKNQTTELSNAHLLEGKTLELPQHIMDQGNEAIEEYVENLTAEEIEQYSVEEDNNIYILAEEFSNMSEEELANLTEEEFYNHATVVTESQPRGSCGNWSTIYSITGCYYYASYCYYHSSYHPYYKKKKKVRQRRWCGPPTYGGYEYRTTYVCC